MAAHRPRTEGGVDPTAASRSDVESEMHRSSVDHRVRGIGLVAAKRSAVTSAGHGSLTADG